MVELHPSHLENAKTTEHWQGFLKLDRINISTFATMLVVGVYSQDGKDPDADVENFRLEVDWVLYLLLGGVCKEKIKPFGEVKGLENLERAYMAMTSFLEIMRRDNKPCAYAQKRYGIREGETLARIGRDPKQEAQFAKIFKELEYARRNVKGVVDPVEALAWLCSKDDATDYIPSVLLQCWHELKAKQASSVQREHAEDRKKQIGVTLTKEAALTLTEKELSRTRVGSDRWHILQVGALSLEGLGYSRICDNLNQSDEKWARLRRKKYIEHMKSSCGVDPSPLMPQRKGAG